MPNVQWRNTPGAGDIAVRWFVLLMLAQGAVTLAFTCQVLQRREIGSHEVVKAL
jgi:hypothetical protein